MTAPARVEARAGRVVVGPGAWSFALDCRTGAAKLALGGGPLVLRPLRWREKVMLARFAFIGAPFVDEQVLRLALPEEAEPPDGDEGAAALALARWLDDPGETEASLPLQPPLLAAVTLEVCAAIGLAPADLDDRDAAEVEALWYAAGSGEPATAPPFARRRERKAAAHRAPEVPATDGAVEVGETTRILIVPDPEPAENEARADETPRAVPTRRQVESVEEGAPPTPVAQPERSGSAPGRRGRAAIAFRPIERAATGSTPGFASPQPVAAALPSAAGREGELPSAEPPPEPYAEPPPSDPTNSVFQAPGGERELDEVTAAAETEAATAMAPVGLAAPADARTTAGLLRWSGSREPAVPASRATPTTAPEAAPYVAPAALAAVAVPDTDELLDELSERLARAAAELGVPEV